MGVGLGTFPRNATAPDGALLAHLMKAFGDEGRIASTPALASNGSADGESKANTAAGAAGAAGAATGAVAAAAGQGTPGSSEWWAAVVHTIEAWKARAESMS